MSSIGRRSLAPGLTGAVRVYTIRAFILRKVWKGMRKEIVRKNNSRKSDGWKSDSRKSDGGKNIGLVPATAEPVEKNLESGRLDMHAEIKSLARRLRDGLEERPVVVSSGFRAIDSLLPDGGVRRGSLVEWLLPGGAGCLPGGAGCLPGGAGRLPGGAGRLPETGAASGGITLACAVAVRGLCSSPIEPRASGSGISGSGMPRRVVIVIDRQGRFHPPAVFPWMGIYPLTGGSEYRCERSGCRLIVVRPSTDDDEAWAIDQSLRCSGVKAVVAWPRRIHPTAMRRWQLAARSSGSVGLIARPIADRREPSWAHVRLVVSPLAGGAGSVAGVRAFQVAMVAGPIEFEERSATVALEMQSGVEMRIFAGRQGSVESENRKARGNIREGLQCHAS